MRLRSGRIVCPDGIRPGEVVVEAGRISSVGSPSQGHDELVDLEDRWLLPGYIDVHVHGGAGAQCNTADPEEVAEVARFHACHGTTGLVATTVAAPVDELCTALVAIARCGAPNLLGAHLEGPFLNPERAGAMDPSLFVEPDLRELERLRDAGASRLRLMTLAPELKGALEVVKRLRLSGVVASLGHTSASEEQIRDAVRAGASAATHLFNAMAPFHHRSPGAVGAMLDIRELSCELICDGLHVAPVAMRVAYRVKGSRGIRLVTDATAAAGMSDGEYRLGRRTISVADGWPRGADDAIAGSTLTMEAAVQNAVHLIGAPIEEVAFMAATNSARLLGLETRKGAIAAGLDADLVVLNQALAVEATMVAGRWVTDPP